MKNIAIIPARGGSKGIYKKNIRQFAGKPLIAYTIIEAIKSKRFDKVIVSTDDDEIGKISKKYGAEVIKRPGDLAKDDTHTIDVIFHLIDILLKQYDHSTIIVLLQPTSPLRTVNDINNSIELFLKKECESVIGVCESTHPPQWSLKIEGEFLKLVFNNDNFKMRRQDLHKSYYPNGAIYIASIETLIKYKSFYCQYTLPYIMPIERSIDIDNEFDLFLAEILLKEQN